MTMSSARRSRALGGIIAKLLMAVCVIMLGASTFAAASPARAHRDTPVDAKITAARHRLLAARRANRQAAHAHSQCRRRHPHQPIRCAQQRHRLAHARRQLAKARTLLKHLQARIARRRAARAARSAPHLAAAGQTVKWTKVGRVSRYVFVRRVPGRTPQYAKVATTSVTPPPVTGATVHYSVRTAVAGSKWAPEVAIHYAQATSANGASDGSNLSGNENPQHGSEETGGGSATVFQPGLNSGTEQLDFEGTTKLGAKLVRLDFGIGDSAQKLEGAIAGYATLGVRVLPLADFYGSMPTPEQARNLASWAQAFGAGGTFWAAHPELHEVPVQSIEFGNETSYSYQYANDTEEGYASRARSYALRFAEAATAIRAANPKVGLLAQGDAGNAGSIWISNMFAAVPDLGSLVAGWTIHPYGTEWRRRLQELISETTEQGAPSSIPIDITEWGLTTDNGTCLTEDYGWNPCMTYAEAASVLSTTVREMHEMLGGRFGMFLLYQVRDQAPAGETTEREAYFGALQHELQAKGQYTSAVEALMAE